MGTALLVVLHQHQLVTVLEDFLVLTLFKSRDWVTHRPVVVASCHHCKMGYILDVRNMVVMLLLFWVKLPLLKRAATMKEKCYSSYLPGNSAFLMGCGGVVVVDVGV